MKQSNNKKSRDVTAFLYERLSRDDNLEGESYSIGNQKKLLAKVAKEKGYTNLVHFLDDAAVFVKDCCAIMGLNQKDLENQGILA